MAQPTRSLLTILFLCTGICNHQVYAQVLDQSDNNNNNITVDGDVDSIAAACTEDTDCPSGQWCASHSSGPNFCKSYAALGESCNAFTLPEFRGICDPSLKCHEPQSCHIPDLGGVCADPSELYKLNECCSSNEECESGFCNNQICEESDPRSNSTEPEIADPDDIQADNSTETVIADPDDIQTSNSTETVIADPDETKTVNSTETTMPDTEKECTLDSDCPSIDEQEQYCSSSSTGPNFCKSYADIDDACNVFTLPEHMSFCNPSLLKCYEPQNCIIADVGGICVGRSERNKVGDCCNDNADCDSGICAESESFIGTMVNLCQENINITVRNVTLCVENQDCPKREWCASHSEGFKFCKPYARLNERCNAFTLPEEFGLCNPRLKCYEPNSCFLADGGGTCVDKSELNKAGACCETNEECESGLCEEGTTSWGTVAMFCSEANVDADADAAISAIDDLAMIDFEDESEHIKKHGCRVGDILYSNGDSIGFIGLECLDDSRFDGKESICQDGEVISETKVFTCDEQVPFCHQCNGKRGRGNAICLSSRIGSTSTTTATSRMSNENTCMTGSEWVVSKSISNVTNTNQDQVIFEGREPTVTSDSEDSSDIDNHSSSMEQTTNLDGEVTDLDDEVTVLDDEVTVLDDDDIVNQDSNDEEEIMTSTGQRYTSHRVVFYSVAYLAMMAVFH